ncbi:MAG: FHA domain-containing protein [Nitriliruptorales bacterium]|nr:FHA domain-containing protein [Nitriliruptorales bacterium]
MTIVVLTVFKLLLLLLLYLFLARALRVVTADLYGPRKATVAPQRPAVATPRPSRRPRKAPRQLVVHTSDRKPTVISLDGERLVMGRADEVDVLVDDPYVSDLHAELVQTDDGWAVRDLGSTNSTFLNGAKVTQPTLIGAGDQLRLGKTRIEVRR